MHFCCFLVCASLTLASFSDGFHLGFDDVKDVTDLTMGPDWSSSSPATDFTSYGPDFRSTTSPNSYFTGLIDSTSASDSTDSTDYTDATGSTDSTDYTDSTGSSDSTDSTDFTDSTGASHSTDSTDSTDATDSTDLTGASDSTDATDSTHSSDYTDSTGSSDSTDSTDYTDATDGTDATDSTDYTDSTGASDSTASTDYTDATDSTGASESTDATDQTDATDGTDATDSTDSTDSTVATDITDATASTDSSDSTVTVTSYTPTGSTSDQSSSSPDSTVIPSTLRPSNRNIHPKGKKNSPQQKPKKQPQRKQKKVNRKQKIAPASTNKILDFQDVDSVECRTPGGSLTIDYRQQILDAHNDFRSTLANGGAVLPDGKHASPASNMSKLKYSCKLEKQAQEWANRKVLQHNKNRTIPTGENLHWLTGEDGLEDDAINGASISWWNELAQNGMISETNVTFVKEMSPIGHWSQMAWSSTQFIGCGFKKFLRENERDFYYLTVCNYFPAGNILGMQIYEFGESCKKDNHCTAKPQSICDADSGLCYAN